MQNIIIIGAGTMGNGIAQVFAIHNFRVSLVDISQPSLDKAIQTIAANCDRMIAKNSLTAEQKTIALANIKTYTQLSDCAADADLLVEAATENVALKLQLFQLADQLCPAHCILASNTSSISITKIAAATARPHKVIGMHFMNPVPVMKLVEIIRGYATDGATTQAIMDLSARLQKSPVEVNDYSGFVANRILMPMINEAIITLYEGVAGVTEIDTVMRLGMAHPMGPLQLADFIGLDVCLAILQVLYDGLGNTKYAPCPLLVNMVMAGRLGQKSGEGFYKYQKASKELVLADRFARK